MSINVIEPEQLYPQIRAAAPGVSDFLMYPAIMRTARDFCNQTWAWQLDVVLSVQADGTVSPKFEDIEYSDVYESEVDLNNIYKNYYSNADTVNIVGIRSVKKDDELFEDYEFLPPYFQVFEKWKGETFDLKMRLVLEPAMSTNKLPEFMIERHGEIIAYGTIAELLLQPQQSWTNPELAQHYLRKFYDGIASVRVSKRKNYTYGSLRVRPRKFV